MIHFQCPACGAPFEVDDRLAGRAGRCKSCGGRMKVPSVGVAQAADLAPPRPRAMTAGTAGPRLTPVAVGGAMRSQPAPGVGRPMNWIEAVNSQVALAPISMDSMPALRSKPHPLDEPSIAGPYKMATAPSLPALESARGKPAGAVTRGYRHGMGKVQKLFRWLNESAYLVSIPFLMCMLLGLAVRNHSLLVLGATAVVLLNIGRILAGLANLVVIPFRESPIQGILFLIPPITFYYLWKNWHKVHRPVRRIAVPIATLGFVLLAFVAEPWVKGEGKPKGDLREQLKAGARSMRDGVEGKIGKVSNLASDDPSDLVHRAREALESPKSSGRPQNPQ